MTHVRAPSSSGPAAPPAAASGPAAEPAAEPAEAFVPKPPVRPI